MHPSPQDLKDLLRLRGVDFVGVTEKDDLVNLLSETEGQAADTATQGRLLEKERRTTGLFGAEDALRDGYTQVFRASSPYAYVQRHKAILMLTAADAAVVVVFREGSDAVLFPAGKIHQQALAAMSGNELKAHLRERGIPFVGITDKEELLDLALQGKLRGQEIHGAGDDIAEHLCEA